MIWIQNNNICYYVYENENYVWGKTAKIDTTDHKWF